MKPLAKASSEGVILILAAIFFSLLSSTSPSPLYPLYANRYGLTATHLGLIFFAYSIGVVLALLTVGRQSDLYRDRRVLICVGLTFAATGTIIMLFENGLVWLVAGRFINGVGAGALAGTANAALVELLGRPSSGVAASYGTSALTFGAALGPLTNGLFIYLDFYPETFGYVLILAGTMSCLVLLVLAPAIPVNPATVTEKEDVGDPQVGPKVSLSLLLFGGAVAASWCTMGSVMGLGGQFAHSLYNVDSLPVVAVVMSSMQLLAGCFQLLGRMVTPKAAYFGGVLLQITGLGCIVISVDVGWLIVPGLFCFALGYGLTFVGSASLVNIYSPVERRGAAISAFYVISYLGNAGSLFIGEAARRLGERAAVYSAASFTGLFFLSLALIGLAVLVLRRDECGK